MCLCVCAHVCVCLCACVCVCVCVCTHVCVCVCAHVCACLGFLPVCEFMHKHDIKLKLVSEDVTQKTAHKNHPVNIMHKAVLYIGHATSQIIISLIDIYSHYFCRFSSP